MIRNVAGLSAAPLIRAKEGRTLTVDQARQLLDAAAGLSSAADMCGGSQRGSHRERKGPSRIGKGAFAASAVIRDQVVIVNRISGSGRGRSDRFKLDQPPRSVFPERCRIVVNCNPNCNSAVSGPPAKGRREWACDGLRRPAGVHHVGW